MQPRPASASRKGRPGTASTTASASASASATSSSTPATAPIATALHALAPGDLTQRMSPGIPAADPPQPFTKEDKGDNDLEYAKQVERQLNRAMSARTKAKIEAGDARLARQLASGVSGGLGVTGARGLGPDMDDDDEGGGSSAVGIELDASDLDDAEVLSDQDVEHRPVTARTKQQLEEDETIARQMQIEMLYDLHGSSSKATASGVTSGSTNAMLGATSGSQSPPMVQGSANSLLPSGTATHDLSVTGRSAGALSAAAAGVPAPGGSTSLSGAGAPLGSQRLGLGNEYPMQPAAGLVATASSSKQQMNTLQRSGAGMEQLTMGGGGRGGGTEHTEQSESLWDTEHDKDHMTEGESSPSPEPPLSPNDLDALFAYISQFKPESIDLEPVLKPFLPDYIPAIGDLEAMIKIPAPGPPSAASTTTASAPGTAAPAAEASTMAFFQDLGITVLDEPAAKQSDPAVLHYQLKAMSKATGGVGTRPSGEAAADDKSAGSLVHAIHAHDPFAKKLHDWIASTDAPEWAATRAVGGYAPAAGKNKYPGVDRLMDVWDEGFAAPSAGGSGGGAAAQNPVDVLTSVDPRTGMGPLGSLDVPLGDAVKLACAVLGIPVYDKGGRGLIDALHCLFEVYAGFAESQHFNNEQQSGSAIDLTGFPSGEFGVGGLRDGMGMGGDGYAGEQGGQSAEWTS